MIIHNGYICMKRKSGGGIDPETGYPIKPTEAWGKPIPCQYTANKHNNLGKTTGGEPFTVAQYQILIEEQPLNGERLRLDDLCGREIGEFSIMEIEPLEAVCEMRIMV